MSENFKVGPEIKWALFFSGWGRTLGNCIKLFQDGGLKPSRLSCIVSIGQKTDVLDNLNNPEIRIIDRNPKDYDSIAAYQAMLCAELQEMGIDYIFLVGYKYRIREVLLNGFDSRIVNIHPSLLPAFKNTQSAMHDALDLGVKISGTTTHIIDNQIDEGTILCQRALKICDDDTFESLYEKFMINGEKLLLDTFNLINEKHTPKVYLKEFIQSK